MYSESRTFAQSTKIIPKNQKNSRARHLLEMHVAIWPSWDARTKKKKKTKAAKGCRLLHIALRAFALSFRDGLHSRISTVVLCCTTCDKVEKKEEMPHTQWRLHAFTYRINTHSFFFFLKSQVDAISARASCSMLYATLASLIGTMVWHATTPSSVPTLYTTPSHHF